MVEHTLKDLTVWNGNKGKTYMYQSEFPYDIAQANANDTIYNSSYVGYRVAPNVSSHEGCWSLERKTPTLDHLCYPAP